MVRAREIQSNMALISVGVLTCVSVNGSQGKNLNESGQMELLYRDMLQEGAQLPRTRAAAWRAGLLSAISAFIGSGVGAAVVALSLRA